jgi:hypothetical protein
MIAANAALASLYDYLQVALRVLMKVSAFCAALDLLRKGSQPAARVAKEVA